MPKVFFYQEKKKGMVLRVIKRLDWDYIKGAEVEPAKLLVIILILYIIK